MKKIFAFILSIVSVFSVMCIAPSSSIKADAATYYVVCPADGDYQIAPKNNSNYAIDVVGGVFREWQPLHLYSRSTTNTAQIWTLERQGSSYWYRIKHTASGLSMNVRCGEDKNDARLMLYSSSDTSNASYFRFVSCKGSFIIQSKLSNGRVIDLDNGICFNQAIVHLWSAHDGNSALWNLYNYNNSKKTAYVNTSSSNLYLRSLPGNGSVIASMPKGSTITVLDNCTDFSGFYRVQYGSKIGFASKLYISFSKPNTNTIQTSSSKGTALLNFAKTQLGKTISSYPGERFHFRAWCADFVSYCARKTGCSYAIPKNSSVDGIRSAIKNKGGKEYSKSLIQNGRYIPKAGDIIIFKNGESHVGIVSHYQNGKIYYIDGNNISTGNGYRASVHYSNCSAYYSKLTCVIHPNF